MNKAAGRHQQWSAGSGKNRLAINQLQQQRWVDEATVDVVPEALLARLHDRPRTPVTDVVSRIIEERGGDDLVLEGRRQLLDLAPQHGWTVVDATDCDAALAALSEAVAARP